MSDSSWPHGLQQSRPPYWSLTPGVYPNSCPWSRWCNPTISSSVTHPLSSWPQSFPASYMYACVCLCTEGAGGPGPPRGREVATRHLHVEVESFWVRARTLREPLDCGSPGTVTSPSRVLSWCWPCTGQCHWGRTPDDPGLVSCPYIYGVGPWACRSGWIFLEPWKCLGDLVSVSGGWWVLGDPVSVSGANEYLGDSVSISGGQWV